MKKVLYTLMSLIILTVPFYGLVACSNDSEEEEDNLMKEKSAYAIAMEAKLIGTSWKLQKKESYENGVLDKDYRMYLHAGSIISFAPDSALHYINIIDKDERRSYDHIGQWYFTDDDKLFFLPRLKEPDLLGALVGMLGITHEINKLTDNELILSYQYDSSSNKEYWYYQRVSFRLLNEDDKIDNGEAPQFVNYNFSATQNSITVKFYTDVKPDKASITYGTSATSQTIGTDVSIISHEIRATAKNLKAGTKYYFKCKATNKYGTTTSGVYPAMTNY